LAGADNQKRGFSQKVVKKGTTSFRSLLLVGGPEKLGRAQYRLSIMLGRGSICIRRQDCLTAEGRVDGVRKALDGEIPGQVPNTGPRRVGA
jgi:hypothetical protein